jgi:putative PIN family toxin of toxin-antitoxin system
MTRVVIDTSVLVSAVISPTGPNAQVFELIATGKLLPFLTDAVPHEYHKVFEYKHLEHLGRRRIARLRSQLEDACIMVKSGGRLTISSHEDDNRIYECAAAAKADYIVTENTNHFKKPYKATRIVSARQLLRLLVAQGHAMPS